MELGDPSTFNTTKGFGGRITGSLNWKFGKSVPIGLYTELGYKTTGFKEGEKLNKGPIFRIGLSLYN